MSLWFGHCFNKADKLPDPILTEIPFMKFDSNAEPEISVESLSGVYKVVTKNRLRTANGVCGMLAFPAGKTFFWFFPHDEVQYIVKGRAEVTYSLAGTSYTEEKTMNVEPGDCYLLPRGSRVTFKVAPGDDLLHLDFVMPGIPPTVRQTRVSEEL